ncbi:leucine-rich repeat domain-containing protein [Vibrio penaeicida]|uniref:PKD/Chitinase domain-containing protein n=1 Tax=Vibrio penaeicida TaxID=104609 RepID=A0AAV5NMV3_9VIBR|nr:hypothetical protein [Vibrio penaeicida]RTZ22717.1 hypothetical protein EKN09_12745 [Vibrio penaeicida]GLQ71996.1 hypothetical protein GCM10007932_13560 [Vibrio penaeicida]
MTTLKNATLLLAPLLLAACGGGGDKETTEPTPKTPNVAPVITTEGDLVTSASRTVTLSGNISDLDGSIVSHKWEQISGTPVTLLNPTSTLASFVAPTSYQEQTLVFRLTATDNEGAINSQTVTVKVTAATPSNQAPQIDAITDQTVRPSTVASIISNATDPDGQIAEYTWQQKSGTSVTLINPSSQQVTFNVPPITEDELLTFEVTVKDNQGATANQQAFVHVKPNRAPAFHFIGDVTKDINQPVTIAASAYDRDGTIASYKWEQTAGTHVTIADPDSQALSFTSPSLNREETLTFKVTATDNEGATGSRTVDVTVQNASNLIENLNFQYSTNKSCMDDLARTNNWKFIDEVVDYGCRRSSYEPEFEKLTELTSLRINSREVNLGSHPKLISLSLTDANGTITASNLPALQRVTLRNTQGTIRITNNPQLTSIYARSISYSVDSLDISNNPKLLTADLLRIRQIKSINISNSDAIEVLKLRMSHDSPYINVTALRRLKELYILGTATSSQDLSKNLLLESVSIFTQTINTIALPKTNTLTSLRVHGQLQNIDLDGVTSLTRLYLPNSKLTQIDLSKQTKLESLGLQDNALISLDVSNNTELTSLNVASNPLTSIDISQNNALTGLNINNSGNANIDFSHLSELTSLSAASKNLSSFNVNNHIKLTSLDLSDNPLTSIDLSAIIPQLRALKLNNTPLSSLDVSGASNLYQLHASTGQLSSLTLPNEKSVLSDLRVSFNTLSDLPVAQYPRLWSIYAAGNQLTGVNISTLTQLRALHLGDNAISDLDISNNSRLGCVSVYDNPLTQSTKDTLDKYASESRYLRSITYTQATSEGQCGYDPYTPTP